MLRFRRFVCASSATLFAGFTLVGPGDAWASPDTTVPETTVEETEGSSSVPPTTADSPEPPSSETTITTPTTTTPVESPEPPLPEPTTTVEEALLADVSITGNAPELPDAGNDHPDAQNDSYTLRFGKALSVDDPGVLANDSDPDGDPLSINAAWVDPPTGGALPGESLIVDGDGSFVYQSPAGYVGYRSWTYSVSDGELTDGAVITFQMLGHPPTAWTDVYTAEPGKLLHVVNPGVLTNDTDTDGQTLTVTGFSPPAGGLLAGENLDVNLNGSFDYVPPTGYQGTRTWSYVISDSDGDTSEGSIIFKVFSHVPPVAVADNYMTELNTSKVVDAPGVLANDSDFDGDMLTVTEFGELAGTLLPGESMQVNPDGSFTYVPPTDYVGKRTFMYRITDGEYLVDGELNIFINGTPPNGEPTPPSEQTPQSEAPTTTEPGPAEEPAPTPSTPAPTTTLEDDGSSQTETSTPTTPLVGDGSGSAPTTVGPTTTAPPVSGQLPMTGSTSTTIVVMAAAVLATGVGLRLAARRGS